VEEQHNKTKDMYVVKIIYTEIDDYLFFYLNLLKKIDLLIITSQFNIIYD